MTQQGKLFKNLSYIGLFFVLLELNLVDKYKRYYCQKIVISYNRNIAIVCAKISRVRWAYVLSIIIQFF